MSYKQLKWIILLIPTITVGLWEYVRHEYLLPYISMDMGNWLTPVLVLFVSFTLLTRFFTKMERIQEQLRIERAEKAVLEERERIARELHDGMAQSLFLLSVKVKQLEKLTVSEADQPKLVELNESIAEIHDYVRTGIKNLRQPVTGNIAWLENVEEILTLFHNETSIPVKKKIRVDESCLSPQEKQELIFCLKEAFVNIQKHAQASRVMVEITITETERSIIIKDDGVGFDLGKKQAGHFGIHIMEERCERIGWQSRLTRENGFTTLQFTAKER